MSTEIAFEENGLFLHIEVTDDKDVRLLHFAPIPFKPESITHDEHRTWFRLLELQASGEDQNDHHGSQHTGTSPANRLRYVRHNDMRNSTGRKLDIEQAIGGLTVISHFQFYDDISIARVWTEVCNGAKNNLGLEYISSFCLTGLAKETATSWDQISRLHVPHNGTYGEMQWRIYSLSEMGLSNVSPYGTVKRLSYESNGTWPCSNYLPMGCFEDTESACLLFWQIEHHGSWHWEIGNKLGIPFLRISGPTQNENHWWKNLQPGETFISVPVAVGAVHGNFESAVTELTRYRRTIRRPHHDNENLPVIFNDYMHCLFANPTMEKLTPLINMAAEVGCEIFNIDAGWYVDGEWYAGVGEWKPSMKRFPNGMREPLDYIRSKGMIPGMWIEPEVMAVQCPLSKKVPDDWFFIRHGKRVIDHSRYQLDFRNPDVISHVDSVINRIVQEYGAGYIKIDYNINAGIGTELSADSFGDGLLQHNHAYLTWLDDVQKRYPNLILENCSAGGMRICYSLLSRHSVQSISDQTDYFRMAPIAAACQAAIPPEQAAAWTYPIPDNSRDAVIFNMINPMLMRIHLSGRPDQLSPEHLALVKQAIAYYKMIRKDIKQSLPFWPLGMPAFNDPWISMGLRYESRNYLAIWRMKNSEKSCHLPIKHLRGSDVIVRAGYPTDGDESYEWDKHTGVLHIEIPNQLSACVLELHNDNNTE